MDYTPPPKITRPTCSDARDAAHIIYNLPSQAGYGDVITGRCSIYGKSYRQIIVRVTGRAPQRVILRIRFLKSGDFYVDSRDAR